MILSVLGGGRNKYYVVLEVNGGVESTKSPLDHAKDVVMNYA